MNQQSGIKKIIVIGSGILGASTAYHLAREGVNVTLVDENIDGQATAAGAGIICPWLKDIKNPEWYRLSANGAKYYPALAAKLAEDDETDIGYAKSTALAVSDRESDIDDIESLVTLRRRNEPAVGDIKRLNGDEAAELFPPLNKNLRALYVTGGAKVDGQKFRKAMIKAAQKRKVHFIREKASLEVSGGQIVGVRVGQKILRGDKIVVAAGAWTSELLSPLGIHYDVKPQKGQIIHLHYPYESTTNWPVIFPKINTHYMLTFGPSKVVIGATREDGSGFDYRITAGGVHEVLSEAFRIAPGLSNAEISEIRVGFRPFGPDRVPLIGTLKDWDHLIIATGLGASGLTIGPYAGLLIAKLVLDQDIAIDMQPYDPARAVLKSVY